MIDIEVEDYETSLQTLVVFMLNQELCWNCVLKIQNAGYNDPVGITKHKIQFMEQWESGDIYCGFHHRSFEKGSLKVTDSPPNNCPYILEQTVHED